MIFNALDFKPRGADVLVVTFGASAINHKFSDAGLTIETVPDSLQL